MELITGYGLISEDGVRVTVEETQTRKSVILSLTDLAGSRREASLNKEMFDALLDLKYKMTVRCAAEKEGDE